MKSKTSRALLTVAAVVLLVAAPHILSAQTADQLPLPAAVAAAKTPADHEALAKRYDDLAAGAKASAATHRELAASYQKLSPSTISKYHSESMTKHCDSLAKDDEQRASDFAGLAAGHRDLAKQTK